MCPHTTNVLMAVRREPPQRARQVSSYYLIYMRPHTAISVCYICVLILLICLQRVQSGTDRRVLMLLYMNPHSAIYMPTYYYICALVLLYVSAYYYICVRIRSHTMCPRATTHLASACHYRSSVLMHAICVLILLYMHPHI
jgi:hypothetical protein